MGRVSGGGLGRGGRGKRPPAAYSYSLLSNPRRLQKAQRSSQAESDVKQNSWEVLILTFKAESRQGPVHGPSLEATQGKLLPVTVFGVTCLSDPAGHPLP